MANYQGTARSNYFRVKDEEAFRALVDEIPEVALLERTNPQGVKHVALHVTGEAGGWVMQDPTGDTHAQFDVPALIAPHLADDSIAVLMHVGYEGARHLDGHAIAVDSTGETEEISLHDIFDRAAQTLQGTAQDAWY